MCGWRIRSPYLLRHIVVHLYSKQMAKGCHSARWMNVSRAIFFAVLFAFVSGQAAQPVPPKNKLNGNPHVIFDADISGLAVTTSGRLLVVKSGSWLFELKPDGKEIPLIANSDLDWRTIDGTAKQATFSQSIHAMFPIKNDGLIVADNHAFRRVDREGNVKTIRYYDPLRQVTIRSQEARLKLKNISTASINTNSPNLLVARVTLSADDFIYCSDIRKQAVYKIDFAGETELYAKLVQKTNAPVIANCGALAVDKDSTVYVLGIPYGIYKMPKGRDALIPYLSLEELRIKFPQVEVGENERLQFDNEGRLWFSGNRGIIVIGSDLKIHFLNKGMKYPQFLGSQLTFDRDGNLYSYNHAYIFKYEASEWQKKLAEQ